MKNSRYRVCEACAVHRSLVREADADWIGDEFYPHRGPSIRATECNVTPARARKCDDCGASVTRYWLLEQPAPHRGGPKGDKADRQQTPLRLSPANAEWLRGTAARRGRSMADVINEILDRERRTAE